MRTKDTNEKLKVDLDLFVRGSNCEVMMLKKQQVQLLVLTYVQIMRYNCCNLPETKRKMCSLRTKLVYSNRLVGNS